MLDQQQNFASITACRFSRENRSKPVDPDEEQGQKSSGLLFVLLAKGKNVPKTTEFFLHAKKASLVIPFSPLAYLKDTPQANT